MSVRKYLSFIRFSHSVFALPFALTGALLAARRVPFSWGSVIWISSWPISTPPIRARRCVRSRAA